MGLTAALGLIWEWKGQWAAKHPLTSQETSKELVDGDTHHFSERRPERPAQAACEGLEVAWEGHSPQLLQDTPRQLRTHQP